MYLYKEIYRIVTLEGNYDMDESEYHMVRRQNLESHKSISIKWNYPNQICYGNV